MASAKPPQLEDGAIACVSALPTAQLVAVSSMVFPSKYNFQTTNLDSKYLSLLRV